MQRFFEWMIALTIVLALLVVFADQEIDRAIEATAANPKPTPAEVARALPTECLSLYVRPILNRLP